MAQSPTTAEPEINLAEARSLLERHFGAGNVPEKYINLLAWWEASLANADAPHNQVLACARDLDEVIGPIAGGRASWRMRR